MTHCDRHAFTSVERDDFDNSVATLSIIWADSVIFFVFGDYARLD
jgi:hypothetical protein